MVVPLWPHAWNSRYTYTSHCGGSGALRKCAYSYTYTYESVRARGNSAALPRYTYGQVEPLVLLNLITSEDRYFRVSFPGNRPRDSAASAYFICVREPTPFTTLSSPVRLPVCLLVPSHLPLASCSFVVIHCNTKTSCERANLLPPFRFMLNAMKVKMFLVVICCNNT